MPSIDMPKYISIQKKNGDIVLDKDDNAQLSIAVLANDNESSLFISASSDFHTNNEFKSCIDNRWSEGRTSTIKRESVQPSKKSMILSRVAEEDKSQDGDDLRSSTTDSLVDNSDKPQGGADLRPGTTYNLVDNLHNNVDFNVGDFLATKNALYPIDTDSKLSRKALRSELVRVLDKFKANLSNIKTENKQDNTLLTKSVEVIRTLSDLINSVGNGNFFSNSYKALSLKSKITEFSNMFYSHDQYSEVRRYLSLIGVQMLSILFKPNSRFNIMNLLSYDSALLFGGINKTSAFGDMDKNQKERLNNQIKVARKNGGTLYQNYEDGEKTEHTTDEINKIKGSQGRIDKSYSEAKRYLADNFLNNSTDGKLMKDFQEGLFTFNERIILDQDGKTVTGKDAKMVLNNKSGKLETEESSQKRLLEISNKSSQFIILDNYENYNISYDDFSQIFTPSQNLEFKKL